MIAANPKKRSTSIIIILFSLFLLPLILAWLFYSKHNIGTNTVNHGQLIQPVMNFEKIVLQNLAGASVASDFFHGKWLLLYVNPQPICDAACQKILYNLRQVNLALGDKMNRVQRAILLFSGQTLDANLKRLLETTYRATIPVIAEKNQYQQVMLTLPSTAAALQQGYIYIVDPMGNLMLEYSLTANPAGILKDLQRLLKVSQIG